MTLTQLADLLQATRQLRELSRPAQTRDCAQLLVRCTARPHEIGVICVCEPVRTGAGRRHDGAFFEHEDRSSGARQCEHACDRIDALGVRDGMATAVDDMEVDLFLRRDSREELRALRLRAAELEVQRPRATERSAAEQRAAEICAAAAGPRHDTSRRARERRQTRTEDTRLVEHLERMLVAGDMELVAGRAIEPPPLVGPDLGRNAEASQQAEDTPSNGRLGHVEVKGDLAASPQVDAAGGVEEAGELGETIALAPRRDARKLAAQVFRQRHFLAYNRP